MFRTRIVGCLVACGTVLVCAAAASAQEPPQDRRFGLTFSYPSSSVPPGSGGIATAIGLVWQTSARTAFRPEFFFTGRFAGENTSGHSTAAGIALTLQRFLARKDNAHLYVGPRLGYSRSSSVSGSGSAGTSSMYSAGLTVGLQYDLVRRIAVHGEVGADYTYGRGTGGGPIVTTTSHFISSRPSLGLELYF